MTVLSKLAAAALLFGFAAALPSPVTADIAPDQFEPAVADAEAVAEAQANLKRVQDGEMKQTKCPFTGGKLNTSKSVEVDGQEVYFCCGNCKAKAEKASGDERLVLLFNDKMFAKAFAAAE